MENGRNDFHWRTLERKALRGTIHGDENWHKRQVLGLKNKGGYYLKVYIQNAGDQTSSSHTTEKSFFSEETKLPTNNNIKNTFCILWVPQLNVCLQLK